MSSSNNDLIGSCIATKISAPRSSGDQLTRKEQLFQLDEGRYQTLTFLRAPAGFGKTTLLLQWRERLLQTGSIVAWYGVDESDNEESQFISYLISSLSKAGCTLGEGVYGIYRRGDESAKNDFIRSLVNDLATLDDEVYCVLDDFHLIENVQIWNLLSVILTFAPANFHLVVASRLDAPFPITELRMHGQLNEIVVSELAFSYDETSIFLNQHSPNVLTFDQVRVIYDITSGWAAALQLIILAFKRKNQPNQVIKSLQNLEGITDIVEYLVQDWLKRLPDDVCTFFLKTSIFDRFNIELATAITGFSNATEIVNSLETDNFFVVPMEGEGQWYRYHHLLSSYLQNQFHSCGLSDAVSNYPECSFRDRIKQIVGTCDFEELNKKASIWFSEHGLVVESVKHALAAGEMRLALEVVESCAMDLVSAGELNTLLAWLDQLPSEELDNRPRLRFAKCWALLLSCQLGEAREIYDDLKARESTVEYISEFEFDVLKGGLAVYSLDAKSALKIAVHWPFSGDNWNVCVAANVLAFGRIYTGDVEAATDVLHWASQMDSQWDSFYPGVYRNGFLGLCSFLSGDFSRAEDLYRAALDRAERKGGRRSPPAVVIAGMLSSLYYETNRLRELEMLMANRFDVITASAYPGGVISPYLCSSRTKYLSGDVAGAREELTELNARGVRSEIPAMSILAMTERIRISLREGEVDQAKEILERLHQEESFVPCIADERFPEVYYAVRISELKIALFMRECDSLLQDIEALYYWCRQKNSLSSQVEALILWAAALHRANDNNCRSKITEALKIGLAAGIIRIFLDNSYLSDGLLLEALNDQKEVLNQVNSSVYSLIKSELENSLASKPNSSNVGITPLVTDSSVAEEQLSNKEIEILQLMDLGMPNKLIARSLNVTVNTVKWHVKNIYSKLGVSSRFNALAKARSFNLLESNQTE